MPRSAGLSREPLPRLRVVAGILRDREGRVLITERLGDRPLAGLWEFPGGKIRDGETALAALARELREEIGIVAGHCERFLALEHEYPDRHVEIEFFIVQDWCNEPAGREGQALRWCPPHAIRPEDLLPADGPVLRALRVRTR